jgi:hypothetical protein
MWYIQYKIVFVTTVAERLVGSGSVKSGYGYAAPNPYKDLTDPETLPEAIWPD